MTTLLEFREKMKLILGKYDIYIFPVLKFVLALIAFFSVNNSMGFMSRLKNPGIVVILALMCSFLPINVIAVFGAVLILAHAYALSLEAVIITLIMFLVMFLLFFRTAPKYGYLLILTPLAFGLKIPYVVPLAMGLIGSPVAAVPVGCGTVVYYLMHYMKMNTAMLGNAESESMVQKLKFLIDNVVINKEMILMAAAFALTIMVVYGVKRMSIDYSWTIAIGVGAVVDLIVLLVGSMVLGVSLKIFPLLLGSIVSVILVLALQLTLFSLDYSRTEYVQFEDDEYYYYVKAVPKVTIAVPEKKVKRISPQKKATASKKKSVSGKRPTAQQHSHKE